MTPVERETVKRNFLQALAESGKIAIAARKAGISRYSINYWRHHNYLTQEEINHALLAHEEVLRGMIWARFYVRDHRIAETPEDFWHEISSRKLWAMAKSIVPEYGGGKHRRLQFNIDGWTLAEQSEVREHIIRIQQRHHKRT